MSGRYPAKVPDSLDKPEWDRGVGHDLKEYLNSLQEGVGGLQGTPDAPSEVQAGAAADAGTSQAAAPSDHIHSIETAAPSVAVALGGTSDEGSTTAVMRAGARLVLSQGGAVAGEILQSNGTNWVPGAAQDVQFHQFEALEMAIENRTSDPATPVNGQIWLRTDLP